MEPITYKLNPYGSAATTYYPAVTALTNEVLQQAKHTITPLAETYRQYLFYFKLEEPRTIEEYTFELLNLGILWRAYGDTALAVKVAPFYFLSSLGEWRKTHPRLKPSIDLLRGVLLSYFLVPKEIHQTNYPPKKLSDLNRLVTWLEATGDFREDAFRYIRLLGFLGMETDQYFVSFMHTVLSFSDWFTKESFQRMNLFTPNVDTFVAQNKSRYNFREDRFSCLRSQVEYHLNMVGAEIMNRAFRKEFVSAAQKTVLVPGCMRLRSTEECKGIKTEKGIRCTGCEAQCNVNKLRVLGAKNSFDTMVIPHSTDLSLWSVKPGETSTAVVGVACLSVLVQGGWELKRNNVPAQCVLLNECGCNKHWHENGFPTELDARELKRIVAQKEINN